MMLLTETCPKGQGDEVQEAEMTPAAYVLKSFPRKDKHGGGLAFFMKQNPLEKHSHKTAILLDF